MFIYKITNIINNKVYIGKTTGSVIGRFKRHINDAESNRLDTHFARAIRKYGKENFLVETIDSAASEEELDNKEIYWIDFYNSNNNGYNMTSGGEGGNTYEFKTKEEMDLIKEKIKATKIGGLNPNSRKVKCLNVCTCKEYHFNSLEEMAIFLNKPNHTGIERRCNGVIRSLYDGIWLIAYEEENYRNMSYEPIKRPRIPLKVLDLETNEEKTFKTIKEAELFYGLPEKTFRKTVLFPKEPTVVLDKYQITVL